MPKDGIPAEKEGCENWVAGLGGYSERPVELSSEFPRKFVKTDIIRTLNNSWKEIEIFIRPTVIMDNSFENVDCK